ncbi:hypothetical protein HY212_04370 [Candidatus Pacearchaeota archaeon]|nr:hypothetical protein [Candidatus Pacearchaeota archaeon]
MKPLIEALGLNEQEQNYFFHLVGHLAAFGFNKIDEDEYRFTLSEIRTEERRDEWEGSGVSYINQDEILRQYQRYLFEAKTGVTLSEYLNSHSNNRDLKTSSIFIRGYRKKSVKVDNLDQNPSAQELRHFVKHGSGEIEFNDVDILEDLIKERRGEY